MDTRRLIENRVRTPFSYNPQIMSRDNYDVLQGGPVTAQQNAYEMWTSAHKYGGSQNCPILECMFADIKPT